MSGTKKWWSLKVLEQFAVTHLSLSAVTIKAVFDEVATGITMTRQMLVQFIKDEPEFAETGQKMLSAWDNGVIDLCS